VKKLTKKMASKSTPTHRLFYVIDPFPLPTSQARTKRQRTQVVVKSRTHTIGVSPTTPTPLFWRLWVNFSSKMLRKENEATPFVDFEMRLLDIEESTFVLCEWTPEYEHLRSRLHAYECLIELPGLERRIPKMQETVEMYEKRLADARAEMQQLEQQVTLYKAFILEANVSHTT
jgi:hypothetical protein